MATQTQSDNGVTAPVVSVINTDPVIQFLNRKAKVSAEEIGALTTRSGSRDVLVGGTVTITDGNGYKFERPKTIQDLNHQFVYGYATAQSLQSDPVFMYGWYPATRDNIGGKGIPDHYFDADGFVTRGDQCLVFTPRESYNKEHADRDRKLVDMQTKKVLSDSLDGKANGVGQEFEISR